MTAPRSPTFFMVFGQLLYSHGGPRLRCGGRTDPFGPLPDLHRPLEHPVYPVMPTSWALLAAVFPSPPREHWDFAGGVSVDGSSGFGPAAALWIRFPPGLWPAGAAAPQPAFVLLGAACSGSGWFRIQRRQLRHRGHRGTRLHQHAARPVASTRRCFVLDCGARSPRSAPPPRSWSSAWHHPAAGFINRSGRWCWAPTPRSPAT